MDIESVVSQMLDQLVFQASSSGIDQKHMNEVKLPTSCFDFEDKASNSPVRLNFKRRRVVTTSQSDETELNEKKVKICCDRKVGYVFTPELIQEVSRLPKVKGRAHQVHELIASYKLLSHLTILPSRKATEDELRSFHSHEYIDYIKSCDGNNTREDGTNELVCQNNKPSHVDCVCDPAIENKSDVEEEKRVKKRGPYSNEAEWDVPIFETSQRGEDFGLGYDCPLLLGMFNLIKVIAGSTLSAVQAILDGKVDIAINWAGGWHHALKDNASGFCYVNDIVIGILKFLAHGYTKIVYIDFDLHHGDGVELAFGHSNKVFTLSFHKYDVGFFPGTGSIDDIGPKGSKGLGYAINVPLKDGITDENYTFIVTEVVKKVVEKIHPQVIIAQFGADGLISDPMNSFNLTPKSLATCLQLLKKTSVPLVILGGGGYNIPNVARCWTLLTAIAIGCDIPSDIPDTDPFFLTYGPGYELSIEPGFRKDYNSTSEIQVLLQKVSSSLNLLD